MSDCIVLTWSDMLGSERTGRTVLRGGVHRPEYQAAKRAHAVVWSREVSAKERANAETYARACGYAVRILDYEGDVLGRARALELADPKAVPV